MTALNLAEVHDSVELQRSVTKLGTGDNALTLPLMFCDTDDELVANPKASRFYRGSSVAEARCMDLLEHLVSRLTSAATSAGENPG